MRWKGKQESWEKLGKWYQIYSGLQSEFSNTLPSFLTVIYTNNALFSPHHHHCTFSIDLLILSNLEFFAIVEPTLSSGRLEDLTR